MSCDVSVLLMGKTVHVCSPWVHGQALCLASHSFSIQALVPRVGTRTQQQLHQTHVLHFVKYVLVLSQISLYLISFSDFLLLKLYTDLLSKPQWFALRDSKFLAEFFKYLTFSNT